MRRAVLIVAATTLSDTRYAVPLNFFGEDLDPGKTLLVGGNVVMLRNR